MTTQGLAALLNGREYGSEITKAEEEAAQKSGLVVVFGQSDDLMEFRGAIDGEVDCYDGGTAYIDGNGLFNEGSICEECTECKILEERKESCCTISARWCKGDFPWSYHTEIPHETFEIFEGSERYCQGIVFSVDELRVLEKYCPEEKKWLFNILRGVAVSSFLPHDGKNELIDFINYLEGGSGDE